jgi:S-adenosylmethionine-diacylglycerol 3-amino-3-carboxypropyl transferase
VSRRSADGWRLRYRQCWEDVDCARAALGIRSGHTVLAIGAAGDNVLTMLLDEPARIIAVDLEPAQCALLEMKTAAVRTLDDAAVMPFLARGHRATERYRRIRPALSAVAQGYWDRHQQYLARGVIHAGRFERYLALFRRWVLALVPGDRVVRHMLAASSLAEQARIFKTRWDSARWRLLFRAFFSKRLMSMLGRDPSYFAHSAVRDVAAHYLEKAELALTAFPLRDNPYVAYALSGGYDTVARTPTYLRPETLDRIRPRLDTVEVRNVSLARALGECAPNSVDAFYLSDVFELCDMPTYQVLLGEVARVGRAGARICYWNNLVPRARPDALASRICSHDGLAARLHDVDRSFFYSRFVVESVR